MRLAVRLRIAGLALVAGIAAAGVASCSATPGVAYAQDPHPADSSAAAATAPASASGSTSTSTSARAATPAPANASPAAPTVPAEPTIVVAGAPRGVKAKAGILVDAATGQVLWADEPDTPRPIASITKVMTALLVIQAGNLNQKITVPKAVIAYVAKYDANAAGLKPGQVFTADELLHVMLIESAADAAYTLASFYGPGLPGFIVKMNAEAAKLGLIDTHFTSPDGLPYPTETSTYSTPAALVRLGEIAMSNPEFRSIVGMQIYNVPKGSGHSAVSVTNDNQLLRGYPGAIGIKTGFTDAAGHTLLFEAVRGGRTLIGVVLDSPPTGPWSADQDATKVLNWGFALKQTG
jgi:D-alanyl-D-alanine carboxypeptidase (penicillin-binding protein 5/6)